MTQRDRHDRLAPPVLLRLDNLSWLNRWHLTACTPVCVLAVLMSSTLGRPARDIGLSAIYSLPQSFLHDLDINNSPQDPSEIALTSYTNIEIKLRRETRD